MSPSNIGVSIDSKAYELALFYVENSSTQMTADEVAQFTRKLGLETRDCALCGYEHFIFAVHQGVRDGFEGEFAFY